MKNTLQNNIYNNNNNNWRKRNQEHKLIMLKIVLKVKRMVI